MCKKLILAFGSIRPHEMKTIYGRVESPHMTNESKKTTPAIHALLRSQNDLPVHDIREMNHMVPDFAARHADDHFKDRAAARMRKNLLTGSTVLLSIAMSVAVIISAISGRPSGQALTTLTPPLISVIGSAIMGFLNRK